MGGGRGEAERLADLLSVWNTSSCESFVGVLRAVDSKQSCSRKECKEGKRGCDQW